MVKFTVGCSSWLLKFQIAELPAAWSCTLRLPALAWSYVWTPVRRHSPPMIFKEWMPGVNWIDWDSPWLLACISCFMLPPQKIEFAHNTQRSPSWMPRCGNFLTTGTNPLPVLPLAVRSLYSQNKLLIFFPEKENWKESSGHFFKIIFWLKIS